MENVRTFFKTLFWTLLVLIVLVGGFWAYVRFFNKDLGSSVADLIYKAEALECPVCEECEVCEASVDTAECPVVADGEGFSVEGIDFAKEFDDINNKLNEVLDELDTTDRTMDEYDVVEPPVQEAEASAEEVIRDLQKRIEELEKAN